jgi:hypothetical protein
MGCPNFCEMYFGELVRALQLALFAADGHDLKGERRVLTLFADVQHKRRTEMRSRPVGVAFRRQVGHDDVAGIGNIASDLRPRAFGLVGKPLHEQIADYRHDRLRSLRRPPREAAHLKGICFRTTRGATAGS